MTEIGIRALKQNASAVVASAAAGEVITITLRGQPVARLTAIPASRLEELVTSGRARPARHNPCRRAGADDGPETLRGAGGDARRGAILKVAYYFDTSALAKLLVEEPETLALQAWLSAQPREAVSCDLARTELFRAMRRVAPQQFAAARRLLDSIVLLEVKATDFEHAGRLGSVSLRTLDAIHIAAALKLGDDLEGLVTYDNRQAEAALSQGIEVVAPS